VVPDTGIEIGKISACQDVEKVLPWTFATKETENAISRFLHFQ